MKSSVVFLWLSGCALSALISCHAIEPDLTRHTPDSPTDVESPSDPNEWETRELPSHWASGDTRGFEALWSDLSGGEPFRWSDGAWSTIKQALYSQEAGIPQAERAVRAALLLTQDAQPETPGRLLARLEQRILPAARGRAACELVCASALGMIEDPNPAHRQTLRTLAIGPFPHPDLDVRVECAKAYLQSLDPTRRPVPLSAAPVLRFLIKVLRAETPAERTDPPTWERVQTLAWTKTRAGEILAEWWTEAPTYRADAPWETQNQWATEAVRTLGIQP